MSEFMLANLIDDFIQYAIRAYKLQWRKNEFGRKLDRREEITLPDDVRVSCWRELAVYQIGKYMQQENMCDVEVVLNGNDSTITASFDNDSELKMCLCKLRKFLEGIL